MSSSDGSGPVGESALSAGPEDGKRVSNGLRPDRNGEAERDPWFDPARANGAEQAEWFLPTGRAGLMPESMSVSDDEDVEHRTWQSEASGAPPWAEDIPAAASSPPPWESGPWPGPGGDYVPAARRGQENDFAPGSARRSGLGPHEQAPGWPPTAVVAVGAMPLVIPGLVVGALDLRRARRAGSSPFASLLAIGLSLVWAVVIIVVVVATGGGSAAGCTSYSGALQPAYDKAVADLRAGQTGQAVAADLANAVSQANNSAAAAQNVSERAALSALAGDLRQAGVVASQPGSRPSTLAPQLAADWQALTTSCPS